VYLSPFTDKIMNIKLTRSGGFMGGLFAKEIAFEKLSPESQNTIQHIIDNRETYQKLKLSDQLRDGFIYTLEIKKQSPKLKFSFDDDSFPKELSKLIEFILLVE
jgi:hypothetical protein